MISILNRITSRARKLIILMIIIPVITGALAFYQESKKPTTYTATSSVALGNFTNNYKMDFSEPDKLVKGTETLKGIKKSGNGKFNVNEIGSKITVIPGKTTIGFQYTGTDEKEVKDTLTDFTKGFKNYYNKKYHEKKNNLNSRYAKWEKINSGPELTTRDIVLNDIQDSIDGLDAGYILQYPQVVASYSNPLKRGIFGLILGLMLDIVIVVLPEFFREYK